MLPAIRQNSGEFIFQQVCQSAHMVRQFSDIKTVATM